MKILTRYKYLILIILLGVILRLTVLLINPPSLYGDELTLVYDSYSLLKTSGYDSTGQFLPITFSMGAGRPAGYVYLSILPVAIFGPTEIGVRLLSALSGVGMIILMFFLARKIFNEKVGLIASLLTAISIWDISLGRAGFEAHLALFFATLGIYLLISADNKLWRWIFSAISFGLCLHTYPTYKLTLPLIFIILLIYQWKNINSYIKKFTIFIGILLIFIALSIQQFLFNKSEARFFNINFLSRDDLKQEIITEVNQDRNLSTLPNELNKVIYNQPLEYSSKLINSYLSNFSLDYLLIKGDGNPRHNPTGMGVVYYVEIITLILGLSVLIRSNSNIKMIIIGWLLIVPIPTSLLLENHSLRNLFMLPPLIIISTLGISYILENRKNMINKCLLTFIFVGFIWQSLFFFQNLLFLDPVIHSSFWSKSAKDVTNLVNFEKQKYDFVILNDRLDNIEYAYQVYTPIDPNQETLQFKKKSNLLGYQVKKYDNVYIGGFTQKDVDIFMTELPGKKLYIGPSDKKDSFTVIKK